MSWLRALRGVPLDEARWVVVDTETSGLDMARDRLLSVGAVAVRNGKVAFAESFHRKVRQAEPSAPENIVVHGIGADAQLAGDPVEGVLSDFAEFAGESRPVAFNAEFDRRMLSKAAQPFAVRIARGWLDLAELAPALEPQHAPKRRSLDDWLEPFGIRVYPRHDALADALATAELFLVLLETAKRQGCRTDRDLFRMAGAARWLSGTGRTD